MFIPDMRKIPKQYAIPMTRFVECVEYALWCIGCDSTFRQHYQYIIFNEVIAIFTSTTSNDYHPETTDWITMASRCGFSDHHYYQFKNKITELFEKEIQNIAKIDTDWKEHANTYLTYYISDDQALLWVVFHPVNNHRQLEDIIQKEVDAALERNEFVPYKYLRLIGRI